MIFTLKNADFSASNIGTLSSWRIVKSLKGVTTESNVVNVKKGSSYSAIFNVTEGYVFNNAVVTMDGNDISDMLVWDDAKTMATLTISSVTGNVHISIIADAIIEDEETVNYYTITYRYVTSSGQLLKVSTTERVQEGTVKNFSINDAPEVEGYEVKEVTPASATITENTTVNYIYELIVVEEPDESEDEVFEDTWYIDCTSKIELANKAGASYAAFSYNDSVLIASLIGKPVNTLRFAVAQAGIFTYGKTNGSVYTELGTIQLTNPSTTPQTFTIPEIRLVEGERLCFGSTTDTGLFYYDAGGGALCPEAKFDVKFSSSQPGGQANTADDALGIDIAYINPNTVTKFEIVAAKNELALGKTIQLETIIEPAAVAANKKVTWSSSDTNVATVSSTGIVRGMNQGSCTITASIDDGEYTATCQFTVTNIDWYIDVARESSINVQSSIVYASFMYTDDAINEAYVGKPINILRFAVAKAGVFTYGKVSSSEYTILGTLTLANPGQALQIISIPEVTLAEGEKLWFQGAGDSGTFYYQNTYSTVGCFVDKVTENDLDGESSRNYNLSIDVGYLDTSYDSSIVVSDVYLNREATDLGVGDSIKLIASVVPNTATNTNVSWSASNSNCTISEDGTVTANSVGECVITVTTEDGGFTATCNITVNNNDWYVDVANSSMFDTQANISAASFAYRGEEDIDACIGKPINIIRFAVAQAGIVSYGKMNNDILIPLGEIQLTNPSKVLQTYEIPRVMLAEGERMWFQSTTDDGKFWYQSTTGTSVGHFSYRLSNNNLVGVNSSQNLSIDIGRDPSITYDANIVTGVTLDKTSVSLEEGQTVTLTATVLPSTAINKNVRWVTSNANCTVNSDGLVTAVSGGKCIIAAVTEDGGIAAYCKVFVKVKDELWYVDYASQALDILNSGSSKGAASFAYTNDATNDAYIGYPVNAIRLAVHTAGVFTYGKVSGIEYTQLGTLTLVNPSKELQTFVISEVTLNKGERFWFQGASDVGLFYYSTTGYSSALYNALTFNIRIKSSDLVGTVGSGIIPIDIGYVNLDNVDATGIELDKIVAELAVGESVQLTASVLPEYASQNVYWSVSNDNCSVTANGLVTRIKEGKCVVTATSDKGNKTATCTIGTPVWYVDTASVSTLNATSNNSGPFAYVNEAEITPCVWQPINAIKLAVATAGTFTYGKVGNGVSTVLGTINLTLPSVSKGLQVFSLAETVTLAEGEKLWFAKPDTGIATFYYQTSSTTVGGFGNYVSADKPDGNSQYRNYNLSISVGYIEP